MRQRVAKLAPAFLLVVGGGSLIYVGGCSLIYNPNNIDRPPADAATDGIGVDVTLPIDAPFDAPPLADANPAALTVESVFPSTIYEGQGVDNSPKALLVIKGHHFIQGATVAITPATGLTVDAPIVSANGDYIAVPVKVDVSATDTGAPALTVSVNEAGASAPATGTVTLKYLPQLTGNTLKLPLEDRYSQIALGAGPYTFTGTIGPVVMHSMSSIKCGTGGNVAFNAKGGQGTSTGGAAGPGGCPGGAVSSPGGCGSLVGGGGNAAGGNGGGGGGYGTAGSPGGGGAVGGAAHGSPLVLTYAGTQSDGSDRNQSGGGAGGTLDALLGGAAGGGGGGGGTVEMTAGGDITCGTIDVSGGAGEDATGGIGSKAGGGGGGSGGVIVVRTDRGTITATLNADFGARGAQAGNGTPGGAGGVGRIRVNAPGALPTASPTGVVHRGLAFAAATMTTYTVPNPMVTILGTSGDVFDMYVVDDAGVVHTGEPLNQTVDASGMAVVQVSLLPGYNRLCATIRPGKRDKDDRFSLADTCTEIAYLP